MIQVVPLAIPEVLLLTPSVHRDARGFFLERYRRDAYVRAGIDAEFVQTNHSRSLLGTVRGLHFQSPPHAQAKLVSVARGAIYDVVLDVRHGSPTFGHWVGAQLDDEGLQQLYVPAGFAHGLAVHSEVADVIYAVDAAYAPHAEGGVRWDDPALAIDWGVRSAIVSDKDDAWPLLSELTSGFAYRPPAG